MRTQFFILFFILFQLNIFGQNARGSIKVIDSESSMPIESALVEIEQLPGVIKLTDGNGIAIFNEIPIGRISIRCTANNYLAKTTHYNNVSTEVKNNFYEIPLVKTAQNQEYLLYGEVTSSGKDIPAASIEIKLLDQVFTTKSDDSGNYSIKIPKGKSNGVQYFRIEIKKEGCNIHKENLPIPANLNLLKDLKLECNNSSTTENKDDSRLENVQAKTEIVGDYEIKLKGCAKNGTTVTCDFTIKSKNKDRKISYLLGNTNHQSMAYDELGNTYGIFEGQIGNITASGWGAYYKLVSGVSTPAKIVIRDFSPNASKLSLLELSLNGDDLGYKKIPFRDVLLSK